MIFRRKALPGILLSKTKFDKMLNNILIFPVYMCICIKYVLKYKAYTSIYAIYAIYTFMKLFMKLFI